MIKEMLIDIAGMPSLVNVDEWIGADGNTYCLVFSEKKKNPFGTTLHIEKIVNQYVEDTKMRNPERAAWVENDDFTVDLVSFTWFNGTVSEPLWSTLYEMSLYDHESIEESLRGYFR